MKNYFVYIIANKKGGTLYIGVTGDLIKRIWEHKNNTIKGFSQKYQLHQLIYYEVFEDPIESIKREKQLKRWHRDWKINLIEKENPSWEDLYNNIIQ